MSSTIQEEISKLEPSTLITLYELVLQGHDASYYFHAGENGLGGELKFKGNDYYYIPIQASGFDSSNASLPRPTISIDNNDSFFSLKTRFFKDFIGFTFKRTRTFLKFLHGDNFANGVNPFGTPSELSFPVERYIINKKIVENQSSIQFELASALEKENAFIPSRKIVFNVCQWRYRSNIGCGYNGIPLSDGNGNSLNFGGTVGDISEYNAGTTYNVGEAVKITAAPNSQDVDKFFVCLENGTIGKDPFAHKNAWAMDVCPKNIAGCRSRFGENEKTKGLPFGGFPGSWGK